ncbi:MAG: hypothetical protein M0D53_02955 [Flavobacterium sp. JAD_PAG50586_2]|nr:MAG: hypothetical protein M0D53_02955 [Flavobacterium sp. JAD_PAG50586_2]
MDATLKSNRKAIIGYSYNEKNYRYLKWKKLMIHKRFEVIALGSSRVLQFRENMFETSFYNAGYTISGVADFVPFLKTIPKEKHPKYLIIGLDQWMFNKNWDEIKTIKNASFWKEAFRKNPDIKTIFKTWQDLLASKYSLNMSNHKNKIQLIGLNACVNNLGFRNDGSMQYGIDIEKKIANDTTANDYNFKDTFSRIEDERIQFKYGNSINPKAISELEKLLTYCKNNQIHVVAFFPPFADAVNKKMNDSKKFGYRDHLYQRCNPLFKKYSFELYDYSSLKTINSNDSEVIDGFHGSEMTYAKMLLNILNSGSRLNKVSHPKMLTLAINNPINRYIIYKY